MPDIRNSGRDSTDQTFFQVGKKPNSTQLTVPTPSPSSAARMKAPAAGARSRAMSASVKSAMPARIADRDQGVGHEAEDELGEDRVERVHHRVGEQPAVGVDRAGDRARHRAVEPERDGAGGVEQDEARAERRRAQHQAEGERDAAACCRAAAGSPRGSRRPSGRCGCPCRAAPAPRSPAAAGTAAGRSGPAAGSPRRAPGSPRPASRSVLVPRAGFAFVRRQR